MGARAFLLTGTNRGNRVQNLEKATMLIGERAGRVISQSGIYESRPWGFHDDTDFLNQALEVETSLLPAALLQCLLEVEKVMGRVRQPTPDQRYEGRIIDIDILFFDQQVVETEDLIIPHPRLHLRRFVLVPLLEIAPDLTHPVTGKTVSQMLYECANPEDLVHSYR